MSQTRSLGTILVVDDKERNIEVVGTTLAAMGYEIIPATSGEQALARVKARAPDLVLLDILMPGMDGFEVCRQLKSDPETAAIPVIFVSAAHEKDVIVEALGVGGVDYVTKPFNRAELRARVKTHLSLKRARDQLHELVGQREELIGMLAHDLKSPLFAVRLSAESLAKQGADLPKKAADILERIRAGNNRAFDVIDGFLARAAADRTDFALKMARINLADCVESVIANNTDHAGRKRIKIHWERPDSAVWVRTDAAALGDVLDNLVSNALKFSDPNSSVWVSIDADTPAIIVGDEGPGFSDEDKGKMFDRFVRLSARPTGGETSTGLGLSIAKRFVDLLGAQIEFESKLGEGTRFRITLPVESAEA